MANVTRYRTGELLRIVFDLLWNEPNGMQAKFILDHLPTIRKEGLDVYDEA